MTTTDMVDDILALVEELATGTIEKMMAKEIWKWGR